MWRVFRRRPKLPAAQRPALGPGERVVAWAALDRDDVVVATNHGLYLPDRPRLGWHEIHKATWSGRAVPGTGSGYAVGRVHRTSSGTRRRSSGRGAESERCRWAVVDGAVRSGHGQ
jgi:hypothetical protein